MALWHSIKMKSNGICELRRKIQKKLKGSSIPKFENSNFGQIYI